MDQDDLAYRKSVRNVAVVVLAVVVLIFAALAISPYAFPPADTFQLSASYGSAFGFTLHLQVNATSLSRGDGILVAGWLNSSSDSIENITASNAWGIADHSHLWTMPCTNGWPIGVGVMDGHYTQANATLGTLVPIPRRALLCPVAVDTPAYFLLGPHTSRALVDIGGTPQYWDLQLRFSLNTSGLAHGVYTAVLADEWGDVLTTNFTVG